MTVDRERQMKVRTGELTADGREKVEFSRHIAWANGTQILSPLKSELAMFEAWRESESYRLLEAYWNPDDPKEPSWNDHGLRDITSSVLRDTA